MLRPLILSTLCVLFLSSCNDNRPTSSPKEGKTSPDATTPAATPALNNPNPVVVIKTSLGEMEVELFSGLAPLTVANFLQYVDDNFYDGTIFHRVMDNFMIQGGGMTPDMKEKATRPAIKNEAANAVLNTRGTIAMARTMDVDSATSQFFINVIDNPFLNHTGTSPQEFGYCVFGKVIQGFEVMDKIKGVSTHSVDMHQNVPITPVVIQSIKRKR
ncbi:MAG: peptidyl-prolyl cis-trans isomerase [Bdellovibrio sp.]|nr:peptidyl-prolyl cis-trans isomerase [Bdellovibrio sp.]